METLKINFEFIRVEDVTPPFNTDITVLLSDGTICTDMKLNGFKDKKIENLIDSNDRTKDSKMDAYYWKNGSKNVLAWDKKTLTSEFLCVMFD